MLVKWLLIHGVERSVLTSELIASLCGLNVVSVESDTPRGISGSCFVVKGVVVVIILDIQR